MYPWLRLINNILVIQATRKRMLQQATLLHIREEAEDPARGTEEVAAGGLDR